MMTLHKLTGHKDARTPVSPASILVAAMCLTLAGVAGGATTLWTGSLAQDTLWTAAESPYVVTGSLIVQQNITLTIQPGVTVLFRPHAKITIRGRLVAEGTESAIIQFTRDPSTGQSWDGLQFDHTVSENIIRQALLEQCRTDQGMIGLDASRLTVVNATFDHCDRRRIRTMDSTLIVRKCVFADMFGPTEPPTTDNMSENIWGSGIPDNGIFLIENNTFGTNKGHNDSIDFDGPSRPKPVPYIRNNVFLGGGDDALDLESDALIEGNLFMNFVKDKYNQASGEGNILSAGAGKNYVMIGNIILNSKHIVQVKDAAFLTFVNNTAVNMLKEAIYLDLDLPGRKPGRGADVQNSIFWQSPSVFAGVVASTQFSVNYCLLPEQWHGYGLGNIDADPLFADPNRGDYHLRSQAGRWDPNTQTWAKDDVTSPCIDAGDPMSAIGLEPFPNGGRINMGSYGGTAEASKSYFGGLTCETIIAGDINGDCKVDSADLAILALHWLQVQK